MKKVLSAATATLLCCIVACNSAPTTTSANTNDESKKNEEYLAKNKQVYKAIETGDAKTLDSLIASDAVDHQGPNGQDIKGTDSVKHMLADIHNHLKDPKFDIIADATNGDYIFSLVQMTGTTADAAWGMPAGTKLNEKGVDVVRIKDGKMVEHWGFVDPNEMMKHMNEHPAGKMKMEKK